MRRRKRIRPVSIASRKPAAQSSQKWLPVPITANETQAGQISHRALATRERQTEAITRPTISASIAWRLGIAAYGFAAKETTSLCWLIEPRSDRVSEKPHSGNIRGGAVGIRT